jgi:hypothetical protein
MLCILGLALLLTWYVNSSGYMENLKSALGTKVDLNAYYAKYPASQVDGFVAQNTKPAKDMALAGLKGLWVFSLLFVFFFFLFSRKKMKQGVFVFLMVVMVFIDLAMVDRNFIRSVDNYDFITQNTPDLQFIKQDKGQFRIIPFPPQNDNEANKWPAHNLESAYAYNAAAIKLFDDIQNAGFLLDIRFLGLFNVKYLISAQNYQAPQIEKVYQGAKNVYLNRMFLPRLFFVDKAKVIPAQPDILAYMRSPRFEPGKEIILEEDQDTAGMKAAGNTLETVSYEPDRMEFKVKMENPSFLFLSEVFFPKWECFVDGKRTKIYRTDYLFRSIKLEKGDHVVVFKYGDNGRYAIQTLGILLLTVLLIIFIIRNRKKYF